MRRLWLKLKVFLNTSQVVDLERAIGQYQLYQQLLKRQEPDRKLYLAVPTYAFEGIFKTPVGQVALQELGLQVIVFPVLGGGLVWKIQ